MAAISSNGTGGGNWSNPATWAGGVVPTIGGLDDVTIVAGDVVTVDTTGLTCRSIPALNGTLRWLSGATTQLTIGNNTSDALVTLGAGGRWLAGDSATPIIASTSSHRVTFRPVNTSQASASNCINMAACNTVGSGMTIVCDNSAFGIAESYTHPTTGVVYNTRRNFTRIASVINTAQANAVLSENLRLAAGGGDVLMFPGSHPTNNGQQNAPQQRTTASYNSGTLTATMTANFTTQVAVNAVTGVPTSGARCYSESSAFIIDTDASTRYWGITGAASANPQFDLRCCTLKWFSGNQNAFTQFNSRIFQGVVFIGPAASTLNISQLGIRPPSQAVSFVSCVLDSWMATGGPQFFFNSFFCVSTRSADIWNVMGPSDFFDCFFQDSIQVIANSSGATFSRCGFIQCNTGASGTIATDCHFNAISTSASAFRNIRSTYGRISTLLGTLGIESPRYFENPVFTDTVVTIFGDVNTRTSQTRSGFAAGLQSPSGATAPSTLGVKLAPGGNTTGFSTPPDAIAAPPSGATIYNRLVTTAAIAPTFAAEPFRAAQHEYQFIVTSGRTYTFTVPMLSVSGFTPTSLTAIRLILTWANGASVTTTVSGLTANVWSLQTVSGTAPVSGSATLQVYVQANVGSLYIDYPLDCDPAGYRWTNGLPQVAQTLLADSSAGTIALAVWSAQATLNNSAGSMGRQLNTTKTNADLIPATV